MATTAFSSVVAAASSNPEVGTSIGLLKSPFLTGSKLFTATPSPLCGLKAKGTRRRPSGKCYAKSPLDRIPKQFRKENLKEGLDQNFKNVPPSLYGLNPSQMDMFMAEDNPFSRQAGKVTEESLTSAHSYLNNGGMYTSSGKNEVVPSRFSMSASMYRGGGGGRARPRSAPPDLPSLLLDARIVYLGMPIVPAVTELIVAQFMWLDYDNPTKPIYLYINSPGTQNEVRENVGSETDAYAIADSMTLCKPDVYTVNIAMAYGQAAMLFALGAKGYRGLMPYSCTKLYMPKVNHSSGPVIDMWIKAKELDANTEYFLELLEKGIGKPKDEIFNDIQRSKFFMGREAIDYGIADKVLELGDNVYERKNFEERRAKSVARPLPQGRGSAPQSSPSASW